MEAHESGRTVTYVPGMNCYIVPGMNCYICCASSDDRWKIVFNRHAPLSGSDRPRTHLGREPYLKAVMV